MGANQSFVIVGGGQAGAWAAKTLRQEGFEGRLVLLGAEGHPPYERPPLSKQILLGQADVESAFVFPAKSYADWGIELRLRTTASSLDPSTARVELSDGDTLHYDRLLLATGGFPRKLDLPGASLTNVFYLRAVDDTLAIRPQLGPSAHLLVIGGGWIGLEVAASAHKLGTAVTLVESAKRLCGRAVPPEVSNLLHELHRDHGIDVRLNTEVTALEGGMQVERAKFSTGEALDVSVVVIGVGIAPVTELAARANLALDNGIVVDDFMRSSIPNIFAAGDVANFRDSTGQRKRLESWDNAQKQGIAAGKAMLDKQAAIPERYPWFWSDQFDCNIQLLGSCIDCNETVPLPQADASQNVSLYLRGGQVAGAVGINAGRIMRLLKRSLDSGRPIDAQALATSGRPLQEALKP